MIKVEQLNKYFNRHKKNEIHAINNTTISFEDTGMVCILGESGSGKTTLLNTIGGLDSFSSGSITVDDEKLERYKPDKMDKLRNRKYGYIFQNYYLLSDYTVEYNIRIALKCFRFTQKELEDRINYVLEAVEMRKYKKKLVSELSGGQRQRVAIARALAKTPEVIFADEPTGNLDENNTLRIMSILKKISRSCLVILVTHEQRIAEFFADRIIKVKDGVVVEDKKNTRSGGYISESDTAIYLKELEKQELASGDVNVNVYDDGTKLPVTINIVFSEGKLYIDSASSVKVEYITEESETQLIDDVRSEVSMEQVDNFDFSLERLPADGKNKLSFGELFAMALYNIRNTGKKQLFMYIVFVISSVLMLLSVSDFYRVATVEPWEIADTDSHYVVVECDAVYYASMAYEEFEKNSGLDGELYSYRTKTLAINSYNYSQLKLLNQYFSDFSYVDMKYLDENSIIYGRMPENEYEIVVEKAVLESILNGETILAGLADEVTDFLYTTALYNVSEAEFFICGICDNGERSVYIDAEFIQWDVSESDITTNPHYYMKNFQLYTDEPEAVVEFFNDYNDKLILEEYGELNKNRAPLIRATYKYGEQIEAYEEQIKDDIGLRSIITGIVIILSFVVLIFTMKANSLRRTEELVVYRMIGISPSNILMSYAIEMSVITAYTQVVPIALTAAVCKYLSGINAFDFATLCPWNYIVLLIAGIFAINILVAILSVIRIIKLPPAQLAAKN